MAGIFHVVCRTCATYDLHDGHEEIVDSRNEAEHRKKYHLEANTGHNVRIAEVA